MKDSLKETLKNRLEPQLGAIKDISFAKSDKGLDEIIIIASGQASIIIQFCDGDKNDLQLFLKICKSGSVAEYFNKEMFTFVREQYFYENIAPELCKSLFKASISNDFILKYYGKITVENDIYLIMEDFIKNDFLVTPKNEFHDLPLIKASITCLARLHASFFNTDTNKHQEWQEFLSKKETFDSPRAEKLQPFFQGPYVKNLKLMHALAMEKQNGNKLLNAKNIKVAEVSLIEKLQTLSSSYIDIFHHFSHRKNKFFTISHGDFHMWNIAAKRSDLSQIKFFDYQSPRFASVVNDILQYLYQVSTVELRKNHLESILECYVENFNEVIKATHPQHMITTEEIHEEYKSVSPWGFLYGFSFILPRYVNKAFYSSIENFQSSNDIFDLLVKEAISEEVWEKLSLMAEMVEEANQLGTIDIMEEIHAKYKK